ncbi:molybdopterin molybdotransferase MoeA [Swingsia samuiensis]|uniref:Molybdopterin molybdenumtransferase n=1 Tax=Swingsia samuiensis TaxID=1293412 RepID=A0A4Y6ULJ7_9PROT|nr:molybdopterin molybdotransferase MoeA [Swingsia samuiensis]QDH17336.1 molybdopterin molybdotransferase MoeA [Swingsia samuiensis]
MEQNLQELLSVQKAEKLVLGYACPFGTERISLPEASGRILRQTIKAERAQPPYDRVMMDGVAYRYVADRREFLCHGVQRAGKPPKILPDGASCIEVMTGAVLPEGADVVVPVERIIKEGKHIRLQEGYYPEKGQFIHVKAADCKAGSELLKSGARLNAPALGVLAGNGYAEVEVSRIPSIALVSTGDELVDVGAAVKTWQIRRSNEYALMGVLAEKGLTKVERFVIRDELSETIAQLQNILERHDVIILSGGVSMGAFDYVPTALAKLRVEKVFHKVAQRPGKPLWFGVGPEGQRVFGLPGNPVSALSCAARYILPMLKTALCYAEVAAYPVEMTESVNLVPEMARFLPVKISHDQTGKLLAHPRPIATSGDFNFLAETDGIVELPPGVGRFDAGGHALFYEW